MNIFLKYRVWNKNIRKYVHGVYIDGFGTLMSVDAAAGIIRPVNEDDYIVEQCTGNADKDGALIYAGDIICYDDTPYNAYASKIEGEVIYTLRGFAIRVESQIELKQGNHYFCNMIQNDAFWRRKTKIIGNIHEEKWGIEK